MAKQKPTDPLGDSERELLERIDQYLNAGPNEDSINHRADVVEAMAKLARSRAKVRRLDKQLPRVGYG